MLTTGGTLAATDVDSSDAFVVQTDVAGCNGYGKFSIDAGGAWTYTMDSAHDEFVAGRLHRQLHGGHGRRHDAGGDGHHPGTNDAAVITGTATAGLTETNAAQSTGGTLAATDVDSSRRLRGADRRGGQQRLRQVHDRRGGAWTYTMNTAHDEFVGGHELHRQHHGGHGRRHDAGASRSPCTAPTMRR